MISETLQKARGFEAKYAPFIPNGQRPAFHVTPAIGWMNDPNGFSLYQGEYHLFYQYHPYSCQWGPMHWGHVKTRDFLRWEYLPAALAPDMEYDQNGCFSGSAMELPDGRQLLVYTGVRRRLSPDGRTEEIQTQCQAIGDGVNYDKCPANPMLTDRDLPAGGSALDFRDPKAWRDGDGVYRMVVGNRTRDGSGAVLLYESRDVQNWRFVTTLDASHNQYGRMWECPDFFPLDGKQVLLVSPQEMSPIGLEFHAGNGTVCFIGSYDPETRQFRREHVQAIDYGIDFYAPQTLLTPDGRRVMIAWMQNWSTTCAVPHDCRWFGQMSLPRELHIRNGRLIQTPVRELEAFRRDRVSYQNVLVNGETYLHGLRGRMVDMTVNVRPVSRDSYACFRVNVARDGEFATTIRYKPDTSILKIDRTRSGSNADIVHTRSFLVRPRDGELELRIVLDRYSVEVFVNGGEQAASAVIYTPQEADAISFDAEGSVLVDVEKYDIVCSESSEERRPPNETGHYPGHR